MNDIINTKGLDISKPKSFAQFVAIAKEVQGQLDLAWGLIEQQMIDRNVKSLKGDWGSATIGERKNWKAETELPPRFYKKALDTSKLNFMLNHGDTLPEGAAFTSKQYLTKRIK